MTKRRCSVAGCKGYSKRTVFKFPNPKEEGFARFNLWLERLKAHQYSAWKPDARYDGICEAHFDPSLIATIDPLSTDTAAKCASKNLGCFQQKWIFALFFFHFFSYLHTITCYQAKVQSFRIVVFWWFRGKERFFNGFLMFFYLFLPELRRYLN